MEGQHAYVHVCFHRPVSVSTLFIFTPVPYRVRCILYAESCLRTALPGRAVCVDAEFTERCSVPYGVPGCGDFASVDLGHVGRVRKSPKSGPGARVEATDSRHDTAENITYNRTPRAGRHRRRCRVRPGPPPACGVVAR